MENHWPSTGLRSSTRHPTPLGVYILPVKEKRTEEPWALGRFVRPPISPRQTIPTQTFFRCLRHEKKFVWVDEKKFVWVKLTHEFLTNTKPTKKLFFTLRPKKKSLCGR